MRFQQFLPQSYDCLRHYDEDRVAKLNWIGSCMRLKRARARTGRGA